MSKVFLNEAQSYRAFQYKIDSLKLKTLLHLVYLSLDLIGQIIYFYTCAFFSIHTIYFWVCIIQSFGWWITITWPQLMATWEETKKIQIVDQNTSQNQTLLTKHVSKTNECNACWHVNYLCMSWHKAKTWKRRVIIKCVGSRGRANQRLKLTNFDIWICNCAGTCIMLTRLCVIYF